MREPKSLVLPLHHRAIYSWDTLNRTETLRARISRTDHYPMPQYQLFQRTLSFEDITGLEPVTADYETAILPTELNVQKIIPNVFRALTSGIYICVI